MSPLRVSGELSRGVMVNILSQAKELLHAVGAAKKEREREEGRKGGRKEGRKERGREE